MSYKSVLKLCGILIVATAMSVIGVLGIRGIGSSVAFFRYYELIVPSCLTWLLLAPIVKNAPIGLTLAIGFLSPVLGAFFVVLLGAGPLAAPSSLERIIGGMFLSLSFMQETAVITFPVGVTTALIIRWIVSSEDTQKVLA